MRRLINYALFTYSTFIAIMLILILAAYPINFGRLLLYIFLLILPVLVSIDLGLNEALSKKIDRYLTGRRSLIIQSLIIVVPYITITIWSMNYVNALIKSDIRYYIGETYKIDLIDFYSIYLVAIVVALYIVYYYAKIIYNYLISKIRCKQ